MDVVAQEELKRYIRDIPNFPKPGILFRDITPLLSNARVFQAVIDQLASRYEAHPLDAVVAIESRGLIFGATLAYRLGASLVLVRKAGKLPAKTLRASYTLEYGEGILEIHQDSLTPQSRVIVVDDLLATGGTMSAVVKLVERLDAQIVEIAFLIELTDLNGRERLRGYPVVSLIQY